MIKKHTTLTIDDEVLAKAKDRGINMSDVAERALQERLGIIDKQVDMTVTNWEFCDREQDIATKENLKGMHWICPDEKWICFQCLENKIERLKITTH